MFYQSLIGVAALASAASAQIMGFNYGAQGADQQSFTQRFLLAQTLDNSPGFFNSARLYTMCEFNTANTPSSAIAAAIATKTRLLLGIWASAGQAVVTNEIDALKSAIQQYGTAFTDLIDGISVGSEDLYRDSPLGEGGNPGCDPDVLVEYIGQVKAAIAGTTAAGALIGHVDAWTGWLNESNQAVVDACDWIGFDGYPYWQLLDENDISNARELFWKSYNNVVEAVNGKPVWVTETGWAVSGPTQGKAVANVANAKRYWDDVGCELFGKTNVWWYILNDSGDTPSFAIVGPNLHNPPLFDLSCPKNSYGDSAPTSSALPITSSVSSATTPPFTLTNASSTAPTIPTPIPSKGLENITTSGNGTGFVTTAVPATTLLYTYSTTAIPVSYMTYNSNGQPASIPITLATYTILATGTYTVSKTTTMKTSTKSTAATISGACTTKLTPDFEFPHLIVPVDSANPDNALGNSYNGKVNSTISSVFNFDIPASLATGDKTCTLFFLLPSSDQLKTSSFTTSGEGGISIAQVAPATQNSTYNSVTQGGKIGGVGSVSSGQSYTVSSGKCSDLAGQTVGYLMGATGNLSLEWFEDSGSESSSPIGLFMNVC